MEKELQAKREGGGGGAGRQASGIDNGPAGGGIAMIDSDTSITPGSREAIFRAAGAACFAIDEVSCCVVLLRALMEVSTPVVYQAGMVRTVIGHRRSFRNSLSTEAQMWKQAASGGKWTCERAGPHEP